MNAFWDALTLGAGYNAAVVALGCAAFGLAAGGLGCFVLLRGRALVTDAAAHATLPGVCLAFLVAAAVGADPRGLPWLLGGAAITAALGVLAVGALARTRRLRDDSAMALVVSIGFGTGVALLSVVQALPVGGQAGLNHFILGQAAGMRAADAWTIAAIALTALVALAVLFRPFATLCFDPEFAAAAGLNVRLLDAALLGLALAVTVAGLRAVGLILVVALMVVPAATARLATDRLEAMVPLAALCGAVAAWVGTAISAVAPKLPTGATITLVAVGLFLVALLLAPRRGLLAFARRQARLALGVARDHALRGAWEARERDGAAPAWRALGATAGWSAWQRLLLPRWMAWRGLVEAGPGPVRLTARGQAAATDLVRRHRLWEHYLAAAGGVREGAAHRSADAVEHTLPADVTRDAEAWLAANAPARLGGAGIPPPIEGAAR